MVLLDAVKDIANVNKSAPLELHHGILNLTLRLLRLAGLVGDGLGDLPDRGVES